MNRFTYLAASKERHSDETNFAIYDGSKNVNTKHKPEAISSYGGKTPEHFVIGGIKVYRDMQFTSSGLTHLAEVVYAIEIARFLWPVYDQQKGGIK